MSILHDQWKKLEMKKLPEQFLLYFAIIPLKEIHLPVKIFFGISQFLNSDWLTESNNLPYCTLRHGRKSVHETMKMMEDCLAFNIRNIVDYINL